MRFSRLEECLRRIVDQSATTGRSVSYPSQPNNFKHLAFLNICRFAYQIMSKNTSPLDYEFDSNGSRPFLPSINFRRHLRVTLLRGFFKLLPHSVKCLMYRCLCSLGPRRGWAVHPVLHRLPLGLALKYKISTGSPHPAIVEAAGLRYLDSCKISGANFPLLIDLTLDGTMAYMLSTYIDGDPLSDVLEHFSAQDWDRLCLDLRAQLRSIRQQSTSTRHICNAAGGIIDDPRMSWVAEHGRRVTTAQEFFSQVWLGLDLPRNASTIRPLIQPLINRPVSINFCHGDVYPRNILLPGGFSTWREGKSRLCLVDWEYSGWMPAPWEALKATFIECDSDTEWLVAIRKALPEFNDYLDADWEWRSNSGMMLI